MKMPRTFLAIFLILLFSAGSIHADGCYSRLIVFGDSNVDSGAAGEYSLFHLTGGQIPGSPNVGGRSCNGPVVVEYAAELLDVPLENYGVGGAQTGEGNLVYFFLPYLGLDLSLVDVEGLRDSGVLSQLKLFEDTLRRKKADRRALYILWAGSNDLFGATDEDLVGRIDSALFNIETAIEKLTRRGARYILVATRTIRPEYYEPNNVNGVVFNARLRVLIQRLNEERKSKIEIFEAFDLISDMTYNPDPYGFVETTLRCAFDPDCVSNPAVSDTYITWDDAHKTTRVHEIMAAALANQALKMRKCKNDDDDEDDEDDD